MSVGSVDYLKADRNLCFVISVLVLIASTYKDEICKCSCLFFKSRGKQILLDPIRQEANNHS